MKRRWTLRWRFISPVVKKSKSLLMLLHYWCKGHFRNPAALNSLYVFVSKATLTQRTLAATASSCCGNYRANSTQAFNGGTVGTQVEQRITARCLMCSCRAKRFILFYSPATSQMNSRIIPPLVQYQLTAGECIQTEAVNVYGSSARTHCCSSHHISGSAVISLLCALLICCALSFAEVNLFNLFFFYVPNF